MSKVFDFLMIFIERFESVRSAAYPFVLQFFAIVAISGSFTLAAINILGSVNIVKFLKSGKSLRAA